MQSFQKKSSNALVVMLKVPVAGQVKTRLVPPLTEQDAARLYECFIQDTFSRISVLKGIDIIAALGTPPPLSPCGDRFQICPQKRGTGGGVPRVQATRVKKIVPSGITIILQKGKDLGQRLSNIFSELFSLGYKKVAIIGTDSPDLPIDYIKKSFSLLKSETELVVGPAQDGGYYLIALSRNCIELFKNIPWSTDVVFQETVERAKKAGIKLALLPVWYDVDEIKNLKVLRNNLKAITGATKTGEFLRDILQRI